MCNLADRERLASDILAFAATLAQTPAPMRAGGRRP
jgi:hypothetical protein